MIYGQKAYEGFAKAIASRLGLKVALVDGQSACIDKDGTIYLPNMTNYQTQTEFETTCGTIVHEMAHQFYKSHEKIDPKRSQLEHECFNTVLDVADETWISSYFSKRLANSRPGQLLDISNWTAASKLPSPYTDWKNTASHVWKILCTGIFLARNLEVGQMANINRGNAKSFGVDAEKVWDLIAKAKLESSEDSSPTEARFVKLADLAKKIAELLAPLAKTMTQNSPKIGAPGEEAKKALAKGMPMPGYGQEVATERDGKNIGTGASALGTPTGSFIFDENAYRLLAPSVERIAQRIAVDGDSATLVDQMHTGSRLSQAYRILTDGQALARWEENPMADGVAVSIALDVSGSMIQDIPVVAGIARAFAIGMRECGAVQTLSFGTTCEESTDDFQSLRCLGGTQTARAIREATKFLEKQPGEKWLIIITDGRPDSQADTDAACNVATVKGIKILSLGLRCTIKMAGAKVVTAKDVTHLAVELDNVAHDIERV